MAAIEIQGLEKSYKTGFFGNKLKQGLKPLTLSVEEGEVFGCLGPNGAGKTTTLKLLLGLVFPSGGTARILGRALDDIGVKRFIGFLPEQPYFYDHLTPLELLDYYARLSGVDARERKRKVDTALARVGMSDSAKTQLRKFSKGMLQRVGIAQAIVHDPKLVLLDEPMSGLDPDRTARGSRPGAGVERRGQDDLFLHPHFERRRNPLRPGGRAEQGRVEGRGSGGRPAARGERRRGSGLERRAGDCPALRPGRALPRHGRRGACTACRSARWKQPWTALRKSQARLISVTPVQATLEDYFLARIGMKNRATKSRTR